MMLSERTVGYLMGAVVLCVLAAVGFIGYAAVRQAM